MLMIFVGMVAVALAVQAIALIAIAVGAAKARKRALEIAEEIKAKLLPVIDGAHDVLRDTSPKLKVITENLVETSHVVRSKAMEFDVTMSDANRPGADADGHASTGWSASVMLAGTVGSIQAWQSCRAC